MVQRKKPQITIWRMRMACWITKATNTHSEYVILIAFSTVKTVTRTRLSVTFIRALPVWFIYKTNLFTYRVPCSTVRPPPPMMQMCVTAVNVSYFNVFYITLLYPLMFTVVIARTCRRHRSRNVVCAVC